MIVHQKLNISLRQMVTNPTGKGSGFVAARFRIKQGLDSAYIKILQRYRKQFYAVPYLYPDGRLLMHVKVPSEMYNINKISYDVLFEFDANLAQKYELRNCKFFSNSPSFIFTYAYVFNQKGILIPQFIRNLPTQCTTQPPTVRNPIESMGFEKSIYIACKYLLDSHALSDTYIRRFGKQCNRLVEADISRRIADPTTLIAVYQHAQYLNRKNHRKELSPNERKERDKTAREFNETQQRNRPQGRKGPLKIGYIAPRPKLTARAARRAMNSSIGYKNTIHKIKPHK